MDQRFPRPSDRPLIHNPNHQPPSQPPAQSHTTHYHPPSSQPPIQIPFSDPFQRRAPDPFLPNTQGQRRESYGLGRDAAAAERHGERGQHAGTWPATSASTASTPSLLHQHHPPSGPPPPPPPLSSGHAGSTPAPYAYDPARRRSLGGHSPPRYYGGASTEPPTSLAAFANRQMPPPSPSQQQQQPPAAAYPGGRGPIPPPPFSSGRELPGLGSTPRAGMGMSISSILDTGGPPSQASGPAQHSPTAATQSPSSVSMQPPSPRRGQNIGRPEYGQYRRPQTPDKHPIPAGLATSDNASYSASSSPRMYPGSRGSPEYSRSGPQLLQHLYQTAPGGRPYQTSPTDQHEPSRQSEELIPPRPNSQPAGYAMPPRDAALRDTMAALASRQPPYGSSPFDRRPGPEEQRQPPTSAFGDRNGPPANPRDKPVSVESSGHAYSPPHDQRGQAGREGPREDSREGAPRREDYGGPFRTGFRNQYYPQPSAGPAPEAPRSHPQGMDPFRRPNEGPNPLFGPDYRPYDRLPHSHPPEIPPQDRRTSEPQPGHVNELQYRNAIHDQGSQFMQRSRSSLGIGLEGKRRASPLPQAVQGAQAQLVGPGADPSIKSEFGRIFQGLGSGIGGHIPGMSTPSRQSPMPRGQAPDSEPIVLSDGDGAKMSRMGSRGGPRKGRRVKEEDGRVDGESIDGRGTPGTRGNKRPKVSHHHHVHQHNHGHHHHVHGHVHRPEDIPTPAPSAHHHHHIPHHHHHTPRPVAAPIVHFSKPTLTIKSQAVLDSVKDLPSNHLGSELYNPQISLPPQAAASRAEDKYGYYSKHKSERTFGEEDLNCTYTIRVSREYLTREAREKICTDRYIFGTEVYSDDSDPIAMCIHGGWIRGEWPEEVDTTLMDIPPPPPSDEMIEPELNSRPDHPIIPPDNVDLQITLRILPPLKAYKGSVLFGIMSRDSGAEHDGMSWAVDRIGWVDEGNMRNVGRTGRERRKRMEAAQCLVDLFGGVAAANNVLGGGKGKGMEKLVGLATAVA